MVQVGMVYIIYGESGSGFLQAIQCRFTSCALQNSIPWHTARFNSTLGVLQ